MKKTMLICGALCALGLSGALAQAVPDTLEFEIALTSAQQAVTQAVPLVSGAFEVDRIVIYNDSTATCAVSVAAADLGVDTALESFALAAGAGESRTHREAQLDYLTQYVVTGNVALAKSVVSTNYAGRALIRDLTVQVFKATNAVPTTVRGRIYGYGR